MGVVHLWEELLCMALLWIALPRMALMMLPPWDSTPVSLSVLFGLVSKIWSSPYNW